MSKLAQHVRKTRFVRSSKWPNLVMHFHMQIPAVKDSILPMLLGSRRASTRPARIDIEARVGLQWC
jgi:hypothetical protein